LGRLFDLWDMEFEVSIITILAIYHFCLILKSTQIVVQTEKKIACLSSFFSWRVYIRNAYTLMLKNKVYNVTSSLATIIIVVVIIISSSNAGGA
jgi:hypothetical protein